MSELANKLQALNLAKYRKAQQEFEVAEEHANLAGTAMSFAHGGLKTI